MTTTKLTTTARDNHGNSYSVLLEDGPLGVIIKIDGTPGQWYLSGDMRALEVISIDHGQNWDCVNFADVAAAAFDALSTHHAETCDCRTCVEDRDHAAAEAEAAEAVRRQALEDAKATAMVKARNLRRSIHRAQVDAIELAGSTSISLTELLADLAKAKDSAAAIMVLLDPALRAANAAGLSPARGPLG